MLAAPHRIHWSGPDGVRRPRCWLRSSEPTPRRSTSSAGTALSCSTRHSACSRKVGAAWNSRVSPAPVSAGWGGGGPARWRRPAVGSRVIQRWSCHQATALRSAESSRFTVRTSVPAARSRSAAARAGPVPGSSSRASGTKGGAAPRRPAPRGAGWPTSGQDQEASEMRYTRRDAGPRAAWPRNRSTAAAYSTGAGLDMVNRNTGRHHIYCGNFSPIPHNNQFTIASQRQPPWP